MRQIANGASTTSNKKMKIKMNHAKSSPRPKIVHVTSVHAATDVRIYLKECKTLAKNGYRVILIAPNGHEGEESGVVIKTISLPKNKIFRMSLSLWKALRLSFKEKADLYHLHDPELLITGILLKMSGFKVLYDVHEDVPKQILNKEWINIGFRNYVSKAVKLTERIATILLDGFVAATKSIGDKFPENKTVVVQNYPISMEMVSSRHVPYCERKIQVCYIGGITKIRGAFEMVKALECLSQTSEVTLLLAGKIYPNSLESEIRGLPGWQRVDYQGWLSRAHIAEQLGNSRIGLLLFHNVPNHVEAQPNKLFEYMSAGIPVVASDFTLWRTIVDTNRCGLLVDPMDPIAIAKAIQWLIEHPIEAEQMGNRGAEAVRMKYNWESEGNTLVKFYERIL